MLLAMNTQSPKFGLLASPLCTGGIRGNCFTASNSGSVGKGFLHSRYFSIIRQVTSSAAVTFRSPGPNILQLLYRGFRLALTVWLVGVCGSSGSSVDSKRSGEDSKRRGEDSKHSGDNSRRCETDVWRAFGDKARCEADDEGLMELPTLEGGPRRIPTVTILAEGDIVRNRLWWEGVRGVCRRSSSILKASVSRNVVDVSIDELRL